MIINYHIDEISRTAKKILESFPEERFFAFYAEMGAGKTTLINALCKQLGVTANTSSPTFSIINEYQGQNDMVIYHTDWYRLKGTSDAIEAGVQDILENKNAYCFIEWPEIAEELLPDECIRIRVSVVEKDIRLLEI